MRLSLQGERETLVALLVIVAATGVVYSNTLDASFHLDDFPNIVQNTSLRDPRSYWPPSGTRYLGYLSFAVNYWIGGLEVFGYHLANLIIHVCNGLLVFWLTAVTLRTPALQRTETGPLLRRYLPVAAGLIFALHPVQTQAVTYIVQRFASLATLFYLLSLALYAQARLLLEAERPSRARAACLYCLSVVAAAAAMQTKEMSFTLPFVAAGYELLFFGPRRRFLLLAPLAATALLVPLGLGLAVVKHGQKLGDVLGDASHLAAETQEIPRWVYLLTQSRVVVTYLRLLLLPIEQNLDYDFRLSYSLLDPGVLFALVILLGVVGLAALLLRRARRTNHAPGILVFAGLAWFFVTLSVESSVIPIRDVIFEHRLYLPSVGAAVALGTALLWWLERLRLRIVAGLQCAAALLITAGPLGIATYARNLVWKDEVSLWSDVVAKSPAKSRPHNNLGNAFKARGQLDDAMREQREAIRLDPRNPEAHVSLGASYQEMGQLDDAMREYREAIRLNPGLSTAHGNLGLALQAKGELEDAIREYRAAIQSDPWNADAHYSLGRTYQVMGWLDDAISEYREAIRIDARFATAHGNLGVAYATRGKPEDAMREYQLAIQLDPAAPLPHYNLGNTYRAMGRLDDAVREFREAIRLAPSLAEAHNNLGSVLLQQGQAEDAVAEIRRALELNPTPERIGTLANALEAAGRKAEAIAQYERFLDEARDVSPDRAEETARHLLELRESLRTGSR